MTIIAEIPAEDPLVLAGAPSLDGSAGPTPTELAADAISADLAARFRAAQDSRKNIEAEMMADERRRLGKYSPEKLAKLTRQGGSRAFDRITESKCAAAEGKLVEMLLLSRGHPWHVEATPIPDLTPEQEEEIAMELARELAEEAQQSQLGGEEIEALFLDRWNDAKARYERKVKEKADASAARMEKQISDYMEEGDWQGVLADFLYDFVTYPVAGIMGPIPYSTLREKWTEEGVTWEEDMQVGFERMDPFGIFPAAMSGAPGDGDFFYRRLIPDDAALDLGRMKGVIPGAFEKAYAAHGKVGDGDIDQQVAESENNQGKTGDVFNPDKGHELVYWWHRMSRKEAAGACRRECEDEHPDERIPYYGLMLNGVIITCEENWDRSGRPQVHLCSFEKKPGTIFGEGIARLMQGPQANRNSNRRALNTNSDMSAQPARVVNSERLQNPEAAETAFPGQVFLVRSSVLPGDNQPAVSYLETPNNTGAILAAIKQTDQDADDITGVFPQAYGSNRQVGPAQTLGGLKLLREDQATRLKLGVVHMEKCLRSFFTAMARFIMVFGPRECWGDQKVAVQGPIKLYLESAASDVYVADMELLKTYKEDLGIAVREEAFVRLARKVLETRREDPADYILTDDELRSEKERMEQEAAAAVPPEGQMPPPDGAAEAGIPPGAPPLEAVPPQGEEPPPEGAEAPAMPPPPQEDPRMIQAQAALLRAQTADRAQAAREDLERRRLLLEETKLVNLLRIAQRKNAAEDAERRSRIAASSFGALGMGATGGAA